MLPKIDQEGNLYFIKRPAKNHTQRNTFINIITAPFWIFAAIVGFVSAFVRIFSGKQLLGKSRRDSAKESAKEIIDGCDIDIEHEEKRNIKNSEKYPGYAPRNWELIKIENISNIKTKEDAETALKNAICIHHGVIGYEIINPQTVVISNGNCVFSKQLDGKQDLIVKSRAINRNFTVINI